MHLHLVLHPCQVYHYVTNSCNSAPGAIDLPWSGGGSKVVINLSGYFISC